MKNNNLLHKLTLKNNEIKNKHNINTTLNNNNTLFILDWDDTLFPTTWIGKNNIDLTNQDIRDKYVEHFKPLDRALFSFLNHIKNNGTIIIVTNAVVEWVKITLIIIPQTFNLLKNVNIMSARELFSDKSTDIMDWKKNTFKLIIDKEYNNKPLMNIISIGDAEYEHQALVALTKIHINKIKYLKSFRLIKNPTYEQILEQIELLDLYIDKFWNLHKQLCKSFVVYKN